MINSTMLEGVKNLYNALRRVCLSDLEIESYRMGRDRFPVIVLKDNQERIEKRLNLEQKPTLSGDYYRLQYFGVSIVWRVQPSQKEAQQ